MAEHDERKYDRSSDDSEAGKLPVKHEASETTSIQTEEVYAFDESRKLGITSSVFLIINKMIGTGSKFYLSSPSTCSF